MHLSYLKFAVLINNEYICALGYVKYVRVQKKKL